MSSISTPLPNRRVRASMPRFVWLLLFAVLLGLVGASLLNARQAAGLPGRPVTEAEIEERWGIRLQHIAVLADGGLIDFRFQVLDPDKAGALTELATRPLLYAEGTGQKVDSFYHSHQGHELRPGQSVYLIYNNHLGAIKPGAAVSVVLGDLRLEHVIAK